jgi:nucleoid-associated protein YgaU
VIIRGSRYESAGQVKVKLSDGTSRFAVFPQRTTTTQKMTFTYRTIVEGDRLDILAQQYYQDPLKWWVIARANPEIMYFDDLPIGTTLRIPGANSVR